MFQTPFMRQAVTESMEDWVQEDPLTDGRHGIVTDGSHSFFREGQLLTSSVFSRVTMSWLPGLGLDFGS